VIPVVETLWTIARLASMFLLLAAVQRASASTITPFSGLARSPIGFGSRISLSTLRHFCYRQQRKTRYAMELATPFAAGLSPARSVRLRLTHLEFGHFYN